MPEESPAGGTEMGGILGQSNKVRSQGNGGGVVRGSVRRSQFKRGHRGHIEHGFRGKSKLVSVFVGNISHNPPGFLLWQLISRHARILDFFVPYPKRSASRRGHIAFFRFGNLRDAMTVIRGLDGRLWGDRRLSASIALPGGVSHHVSGLSRSVSSGGTANPSWSGAVCDKGKALMDIPGPSGSKPLPLVDQIEVCAPSGPFGSVPARVEEPPSRCLPSPSPATVVVSGVGVMGLPQLESFLKELIVLISSLVCKSDGHSIVVHRPTGLALQSGLSVLRCCKDMVPMSSDVSYTLGCREGDSADSCPLVTIDSLSFAEESGLGVAGDSFFSEGIPLLGWYGGADCSGEEELGSECGGTFSDDCYESSLTQVVGAIMPGDGGRRSSRRRRKKRVMEHGSVRASRRLRALSPESASLDIGRSSRRSRGGRTAESAPVGGESVPGLSRSPPEGVVKLVDSVIEVADLMGLHYRVSEDSMRARIAEVLEGEL